MPYTFSATETATLGDHPHILIAPPGHRLETDNEILAEDLVEERFLAREPGSGTRLLMERFLTRLGGGRPFNVSNVAKMQYFAPGIQWNFHKVVDCGVGLQYRFMRQDAKVAGSGYQTYNNYRPWLNAYVGHTFRKGEGMLRPYVALRVATMLGTTKAPGKISDVTKSQGGRDSLARSLAPTYEATLMGGVRF